MLRAARQDGLGVGPAHLRLQLRVLSNGGVRVLAPAVQLHQIAKPRNYNCTHHNF